MRRLRIAGGVMSTRLVAQCDQLIALAEVPEGRVHVQLPMGRDASIVAAAP
ncbi:hypothetical protein OS176_12465 [Xanthomonadaceae bacterium XH05]|nr:hypothetical protein [Xanthomonadaceae bacterium XH05]